jgi:ribonuclease Z
MIDVLFLGVGAAVPMQGQSNSAFLVRTDEALILVDCGPAILQQLSAVGVSPGEITHIFVTHRHGDHILGYPMFMLWWAIKTAHGPRWPTIIASDITFRSLDLLMRSVYGGEIAKLTEAAARMMLPQTEPSTLQLTKSIRLHTQPLPHSQFAPDLGARFEIGDKVLAFTGDTAPTEQVVELACHADLLVHDSSYSASLTPEYVDGAYGHSTAQISARNAQAAHVKHLALVHVDALYEGRQLALLEEAQREFSGRVSMPISGTLYSF